MGGYTRKTPVSEVKTDKCFGDYGRLIFPLDPKYYSGDTLGEFTLKLYNNIDPDKTVEVANYLKDHASFGERIFYPIYSEAEMLEDPSKKDAGLFFFRGKPGGRFAICCAGGAMVFVGAMHDSFPHALELSKKGYNAFALIYRVESRHAFEDLSRAIVFVFDHARELQVDTSCYSLWGGSAGGTMVSWAGTYGTEALGERPCPKPGAVIMQYIGLRDVTGQEPPTYCCIGTEDHIANWRIMEKKVEMIKSNGTDAKLEVFDGLLHGFGLGTGTVAEGWFDRAVAFWEHQFSE